MGVTVISDVPERNWPRVTEVLGRSDFQSRSRNCEREGLLSCCPSSFHELLFKDVFHFDELYCVCLSMGVCDVSEMLWSLGEGLGLLELELHVVMIRLTRAPRVELRSSEEAASSLNL